MTDVPDLAGLTAAVEGLTAAVSKDASADASEGPLKTAAKKSRETFRQAKEDASESPEKGASDAEDKKEGSN